MAKIRTEPRAPAGATFGRTSFQLVQAAREGNETALAELIALYLPRIRRWSRGRLPAWARQRLDTDDLVQEVLYKAIRQARKFEYRHEGAFQAYIRRAVKNRINDELRRARGHGEQTTLETGHGGEARSPLELAIGKEALERYERAFESLKERDQEAIHARLELGLSYAEVAEVIGLNSPDAARMAVSRAVVRFAEAMNLLRSGVDDARES